MNYQPPIAPLGMNNIRTSEMLMSNPSYYNPNSFSNYPNMSSSSIALFQLNSESTNSLYVDGVPNDTNEREVSRIFIITQIYSALFQGSNVFD
jgi:hypothetical protein